MDRNRVHEAAVGIAVIGWLILAAGIIHDLVTR